MKIRSRIFLVIIVFCAFFLLLNQAKIRAVVYNNRGTAYFNKEGYDQAIQNYDKAIELNPNFAEAYNNRGNAYEDKGEYDQAIQDYNKAIELDPENAEFYTNNRKLAEKLKKIYKKIADYY